MEPSRGGWSRREFLGAGVAATGSLALGGRCLLPKVPFEGLYTDRFTYRQGESIVVRAALQGHQHVSVTLKRFDAPFQTSVPLGPITDRGNPAAPGQLGAGFGYVGTIDTTALAPGVYGLVMDPNLLQPENQLNEYHSFLSTNYIARFVVTPAVAGSVSPILWLHDSLTGVCYGSFGGQSIYGADPVHVTTVSSQRPGLDRSTINWEPLQFWRGQGYDFEFLDLLELAQLPAGALDAYSLVIASGQFEYVPHAVMQHLVDFVDGGGNLLSAAHEFAIFRVRLDFERHQLTTFKWAFEAEDPLAGSGSPDIAGVGMNLPDSIYESELLGHHLWAAHRISQGGWVDMDLHHVGDAGWILEGTGLSAGGVLPAAFRNFGLGQRLTFDGSGEPVIVDPVFTRTPPETVVWASAPSPDGRAWWQADGDPVQQWPLLSDGYATCTLQQRPSGATVVSLPASDLTRSHLGDPLYQQILVNLIEGMS